MQSLTVKKSGALKGEITVPSDKSITHRAIIIGSIANGASEVKGYLPSEDCLNTLKAMRCMGVDITEKGGLLAIKGGGLYGLKEPGDVIDVGNSGTSIRLLMGLLAPQSFFSVITGDPSIRRRPMMRVVGPLRIMGAQINGRNEGNLAPISISGRRLSRINYAMPVASAQVKSALLLAGLYADGKGQITEPIRSRDHTERMLSFFGAKIAVSGSFVSIEGHGVLGAQKVEVPGDISSAAFFIVAATIIDGSEILIKGVGINPTRNGLLDILREMGADVRLENERMSSGEPVSDIYVRSSRLKGIEIKGEIIPRVIDEIPILSVAAAMAEGETVIRDAGELRVKETDRILTMVTELRRIGVSLEEMPDGLRIAGGRPMFGAACSSHGDHRVAMSLAIAGLAAEGETTVEDTGCINTSFPGFKETLRSLITQ